MVKNTYVAIEQAAILLQQLCSQVNQAALNPQADVENVIISFKDVLPRSMGSGMANAVIVSDIELNELREAQRELMAIKTGSIAEAITGGRSLRSATIPELYAELGCKMGLVKRTVLEQEFNAK